MLALPPRILRLPVGVQGVVFQPPGYPCRVAHTAAFYLSAR